MEAGRGLRKAEPVPNGNDGLVVVRASRTAQADDQKRASGLAEDLGSAHLGFRRSFGKALSIRPPGIDDSPAKLHELGNAGRRGQPSGLQPVAFDLINAGRFVWRYGELASMRL